MPRARKPESERKVKRPKLTSRRPSQFREVHKLGLAKDPVGSLSVATVFRVHEAVMAYHENPANFDRTTALGKAKAKAAVRRRWRERRRKARDAYLARNKGEFDGGQSRHILAPAFPRLLDVIADWPDGAVDWEAAGLTPHDKRCARALGWVEQTGDSPTGRVVTLTSGYRFRAGRHPLRITVEGEAARSWARWARLRWVMGYAAPMIGTRGRFVKCWLRGEVDRIEGPNGTRKPWMGYLPGDPEDAPWPDFGRFPLEALGEARSGG